MFDRQGLTYWQGKVPNIVNQATHRKGVKADDVSEEEKMKSGKMTLGLISAFLVGVCCVGCRPANNPLDNTPKSSMFIADRLPSGAHEVADFGKSWCTFRLEVGGRERLFLYRYHDHALGFETGYATETITEIVLP